VEEAGFTANTAPTFLSHHNMSERPYFETVRSFSNVPTTEDGVETVSFLEASDGLVKLFDLLGSGVFGFVQADIKGNIEGVRSRYRDASQSSSTLENLVRSETSKGLRNGTACLIRLTRGLMFLCKALQHMQNDPCTELHVCFKRSYDEVLRHHHTFVVRSLATIAVRAVPYRRDFIARISQGGDKEKFGIELAKWLSGLDTVVNRLKAFLEEGGYGRV